MVEAEVPGEGAGEHCLATMVRHLHFRTVAEALSAPAMVACQQQHSQNWTGRRHGIPAAALLVSIYTACYACCKGLSCACTGGQAASMHTSTSAALSKLAKSCLHGWEHWQATWATAEAGAACPANLVVAPSQAC